MKAYRPPTIATAMEKLVCEHGDFFCVVIGMFRPYSREGIECNGMMYPRVPQRDEGKCQQCHDRPDDVHRLDCPAEPCPHCARKLVDCLGRKRAGVSPGDLKFSSCRP